MTSGEDTRGAYKLWRISRIDSVAVGAIEFLISAKTEQAARELACDTVKPEDSCVWLDRRKSRIDELGRSADRFRGTQIITSFYQEEIRG